MSKLSLLEAYRFALIDLNLFELTARPVHNALTDWNCVIHTVFESEHQWSNLRLFFDNLRI